MDDAQRQQALGQMTAPERSAALRLQPYPNPNPIPLTPNRNRHYRAMRLEDAAKLFRGPPAMPAKEAGGCLAELDPKAAPYP